MPKAKVMVGLDVGIELGEFEAGSPDEAVALARDALYRLCQHLRGKAEFHSLSPYTFHVDFGDDSYEYKIDDSTADRAERLIRASHLESR